MKTTLDLPDDLVREVKLRALREGRKLKDAVAELLRRGLASPPNPATGSPRPASSRISTDPRSGVPVVRCSPDAPAGRMTPAELIALEQETQLQEDLERLGLSS